MHADAPTAAATDWRQILALYDQLLGTGARSGGSAQPSSRGRGGLTGQPPRWPSSTASIERCGGYYLLHAIRAQLLRRLGRRDEAAAEYEAAISRTQSAAQRRFLSRAAAAARGPTARD